MVKLFSVIEEDAGSNPVVLVLKVTFIFSNGLI